MNIRSTQNFQAAKFQKATLPAASEEEAATFHNEPHVPMDAVMRGFGEMDFSMVGEHLSWAALGAASGAVGGSMGSGAWAIPATMGAGAALMTGSAVLESVVTKDPYSHLAIAIAPVAGAGSGLVSGALGYGLSAMTGLHPAVTGAITGAATNLALSIVNS